MKLQVGVKLLIKNTAGQFLFIQRNSPLPDGTGIKWDIPGGRINPDESLINALKREVREEVRVNLIAEPTLLSAQDIFIPDADLHVVRLTYIASFDEEIILGDEHQTMQWLTTKEAASLDTDPYLRTVLNTL